MKEVIKDLIQKEIKFKISLISGKDITNIHNLDFNKYANAFIDGNNIYSYNAISCIELVGPSTLQVL